MIYYQRVVDGKRVRRSLDTDDWDVAATGRDLYEAKKQLGKLPLRVLEAPRLTDLAARYLAEDTSHLAVTTRTDRQRYLRPGGPILGPPGSRRLDDLSPALLRE